MKYFGRTYKRQHISVDTDTVRADDPKVQQRLERIEKNYSKLDQVMSELEAKIELDERLTVSQDEVPVETSKRVRKKKPR